MRTRRYLIVLPVSAAAGLVLGALANTSQETDPGAEAARQGAVHLLRQTVSYEYKPYADPAAMLDAVDVSIAGTVDHLEAAVVDDELDGEGALLVAVRPDETWKGSADTESGLVYFAVPRPKNVGVATYETALPAGTEVVLFGVEHPPATDFSSGDPGVTTYVPVPQGLFIDEPGAAMKNVWAEDTDSEAWAGVDSVAELRNAALE